MNAAGLASLDGMIARLRGFPQSIEAAAPMIAKAAKAEIDAALADGHAPGGEAWKPRKDGGKPLMNAAKAVTSAAVGTVLLFTLVGAEVWHHFGTKHAPQRRILPTAGLPTSMGTAIKRGLVEVFQKQVSK